MKKILTLFFACALSMAMQAQTKHNVYVWVDGEKTLIENADSITFSEPTTPPAGDEEAVDLGLSVKWAQRNLGAENPWDFGTYFAWGEIEGKDNYEWATYKHGTSYNQLTKYVSSVGYGLDGFIDNKEVLDESDDAAAQLLGNGWRMPTPEEMQELIEDCTWEEDYDMGVGGLSVTGPNGNSIFMPFAGRMYGSILFQSNASGYYWTSSLNEKANVQAKYLCIAPNGQEVTCYNRYFGFSIRPVKK